MFKKLGIITTAFAVVAANVSEAFAQSRTAGQLGLTLPTTAPGGLGFTNLNDAITGVMNLVFFFALLLVLIYLVWGGIQWITAGGDKAGLEAARGKITGAIIGIIVVAVAFAIYNLLLNFVGGTAFTSATP